MKRCERSAEHQRVVVPTLHLKLWLRGVKRSETLAGCDYQIKLNLKRHLHISVHPTSTLLTSCKGSDGGWGGWVLLIIFSILNPGVPHTIGFPRRCCLCHLIFVKFESVFLMLKMVPSEWFFLESCSFFSFLFYIKATKGLL